MAKGRKTSQRESKKIVLGIGLAALATLAVVLLVSRGDERAIGGGIGDYTRVADFADIHGLAVDPEDSSTLYAATHHGLFMGNSTGWYRVGDVQDDYMGFTMHPTDGDTSWVSGHPRRGGNMGVRVSTDGGFSWRQTSLEGVDFHAMVVSPADPANLWGSYRGQLYRSTDAGESWIVVNEAPPQISSLAADPDDAETVYAAGPGGVLKSADAGRTFTTLREGAVVVIGVSPHDADVRYAGDRATVHKSIDGGTTWTPLAVDLHGGTPGHIAFDWKDADTLYVATYQTAIVKSTDAGATWTTVKRP